MCRRYNYFSPFTRTSDHVPRARLSAGVKALRPPGTGRSPRAGRHAQGPGSPHAEAAAGIARPARVDGRGDEEPEVRPEQAPPRALPPSLLLASKVRCAVFLTRFFFVFRHTSFFTN